MKCGLELPDDSQFCRKCGFAFPITASQPSTTTTPAPEPAPAKQTIKLSTENPANTKVPKLRVNLVGAEVAGTLESVAEGIKWQQLICRALVTADRGEPEPETITFFNQGTVEIWVAPRKITICGKASADKVDAHRIE
jgi:hypothetical protein